MNNSTCPEGKLEPTYWDRPDQFEYFKDLNILLSSTAPRPTSSPLQPTNSTSSSGSSRPSNAVIGGAIGGSLGIVAVVGFTFCLLWHRRKRTQKQSNSDRPSSVEGTKPEPGELASPVSAGTGTSYSSRLTEPLTRRPNAPTAPPTYSWDVAGNSSAHPHQGAHDSREVSGEESKGSPRSPYTELPSKSSLAPIVELPAGLVANELDAPGVALKSSEPAFGDDVAKRAPLIGDRSHVEPKKSIEKR